MDTFYSPDKNYILSRGSFWSGMFVILGVSAITFYTLAFWGLGHVSERLSCWLRKSCFEAMVRTYPSVCVWNMIPETCVMR
jgi:hypothetical protein